MINCNKESREEMTSQSDYIVKMVFNICVENDKNQFDEQLRLIKAKSHEEAYFKGRLAAKENESVFVNENGKTISWKFIGITDIVSVNELENGGEIFACTHQVEESENYIKLTEHKSLMLQTKYLEFA